MVGAGSLAPFLIRAHMSQRPIAEVLLWNHRPEKAEALAASLRREGLPVTATSDLEAAVRGADLVSCATLSRQPIVRGEWLKAGTHLDLVGAFNLAMREADDAALQRSQIYVDTQAARSEGGDVALALQSGAIAEEACARRPVRPVRPHARAGPRRHHAVQIRRRLAGRSCCGNAGVAQPCRLLRRMWRQWTISSRFAGSRRPRPSTRPWIAGADLVGFVRFAKSPRHVSLETGRALSAGEGRAQRVVLLVDATDAEIAAAIEAMDPEMLQLHGRETPERVRDIRGAFGRPDPESDRHRGSPATSTQAARLC